MRKKEKEREREYKPQKVFDNILDNVMVRMDQLIANCIKDLPLMSRVTHLQMVYFLNVNDLFVYPIANPVSWIGLVW